MEPLQQNMHLAFQDCRAEILILRAGVEPISAVSKNYEGAKERTFAPHKRALDYGTQGCVVGGLGLEARNRA